MNEDCAKRDLSKRTCWNKGETKCIMKNLDVLCDSKKTMYLKFFCCVGIVVCRL